MPPQGGIVAFIYALPRSKFAHRMAVTSEVTATSAGAVRGGEPDLVGRTGTVRQDLRPGGIVDIDGEAFSAVAEHGRPIEKGRVIRVLGKRFGDLVVEAEADAPGESGEGAAQ